jgi:signal peptidase I
MTVTPNTSPSAKGGESKESARVPNKSGVGAEVFELAKTIFYALLIAFVLRVVLFQPFTIPSESMEPTLLKGDYIIVSKFAYGWSRHSVPFNPPISGGRLLGHAPKRGDIIVFKLPRDGKTDYIKRLVGLPGDRMQVIHGHLNINGQPVQRAPQTPGQEDTAFGSTSIARFKETLPGGKTFIANSYGPDGPADNTGVYTVPNGCYFMMGDNRNNSEDSHIWGFAQADGTFLAGPLKGQKASFTGHAFLIFWPLDRLRILK